MSLDRQADHLGDDREFELGAAERGGVEHRVSFGAKCAHAPAYGLGHSGGIAREQLLDEERIAAGLLVEPLDRVWGVVAEQSGDRVTAEPAERDPLHGELAVESGELHREWVHLRVAVGGDNHARCPRASRQVLQQPDRRPLGPVQIVEHEQQRPTGRDGIQHGTDRFEEPQPRSGPRDCGDSRTAVLGAKPREQRRQLARSSGNSTPSRRGSRSASTTGW